MELKISKILRNLIQRKVEADFNRKPEQYPCLIFISHLQMFFSFRNTIVTKFFVLFNFFFLQLLTVPMFLSLIFVSIKCYKVLYMHMFDSLYTVAVTVEYGFLLFMYKKRTQFLNHFHQFFIKNHFYVKKILATENVLSTILAISMLITLSMYMLISINTTSTEEELLLTNRKYPDRRFKSDFLLPFDYSVTPYYEIMIVMVPYCGLILQTMLFDVITTMPFICLHIKGQLDIIAFYLRSIGELLFSR
uniref:Uncharacterized protein n=1 Tax=Cacopsylla melanoneura TaxID=428564 RepID=A0A8D9E8Q0_9HEMI